MSTFTIARLTFQEASRRKILLAAVLLGIVFLIIYALGFHFLSLEMESALGPGGLLQLNQARNFLLLAGMYVVNFLTAIMSVLTSVDTLAGEINSGTIHTLVSKPIRRWEIVVGKWLGFAGMLTLYVLMMGGGIMGFIFLRSGYTAPHPFQALILIWLNGLLLLSVSMLGGTRFSTLANGVLVFGLYGIAFIGGWIEQIGAFFREQAAGQTAVNIGIITSLIMPSEALWKRAAYELQSPLLGMMAGTTPFTANYYPSTAMIVYTGVYLLAIFALTVRQFNRRDL